MSVPRYSRDFFRSEDSELSNNIYKTQSRCAPISLEGDDLSKIDINCTGHNKLCLSGSHAEASDTSMYRAKDISAHLLWI